MEIQNYKYGNNGEIPFRYVARRGRSYQENQYLEEDKKTGLIQEVNLNENSLKNLNKGFEVKGVSLATRKKISKACRVLALAADKKKIKNSKGVYVDHLVSFLTLTLPSEQIHDDKFITKEILGRFLDKCRKLNLLKNYVWRAEKQGNGNIHYHIVTDTYASFSMMKRIWLLALDQFGYVYAYTQKFSKLSFQEYRNLPFNQKRDAAKVASAYADGVRKKWNTPPCFDMDNVSDVSGVAKYISKYVSKNKNSDENIVQGRQWSCSSSVSESVKAFCGNSEFSNYWFNVGHQMLNKQRLDYDYFSIVLCKISSLLSWFPSVLKVVKDILKIHFTPCDFHKNRYGYTIR